MGSSFQNSPQHPPNYTMMKLVVVAACLVAVSLAAPQTKNEFTCDLCKDIITDIDEFLVSDQTEQDIVEFVQQICAALGAIISGFEATCNFLIQSQLPEIIEGIVNDNLNPEQVCTDILFACP